MRQGDENKFHEATKNTKKKKKVTIRGHLIHQKKREIIYFKKINQSKRPKFQNQTIIIIIISGETSKGKKNEIQRNDNLKTVQIKKSDEADETNKFR